MRRVAPNDLDRKAHREPQLGQTDGNLDWPAAAGAVRMNIVGVSSARAEPVRGPPWNG